MNTPKGARRSTRSRQSVNYKESPIETPKTLEIGEKNISDISSKIFEGKSKIKIEQTSPNENVDKNNTKTPKSSKKTSNSQDHPAYTPKKWRGDRTQGVLLKTIEVKLERLCPEEESKRTSTRARKSTVFYSEPNLKNLKPNDDEETSEKEIGDSDDDKNDVQKPTELFEDDEDVAGRSMFLFKTPKKSTSMADRAQHTPKTPRHNDCTTPKHNLLSKTPSTPTSRPSAAEFAKTPSHIRQAIKKKLEQAKNQAESGDESDYDFNEGSSETSESGSESEPSDTPPKKSQPIAARILKTPSVATALNCRRSTRTRGDFHYVLKSDDYFSSSKSKTSDHTLDRLKNPRQSNDQLISLLSKMELSNEHKKALEDLNSENTIQFDKWLTLFGEGFTIILHGLGSKRNLLQKFHKERLSAQHVIVINGFFPSLTIKEILDNIWVDVLEMPTVGGNPFEIVNMIEKEMKLIPALNLFLIVHNIDGTMLRNERAQAILSHLATIRNIHMIASMDHINTPMLWNSVKLSNFNFCWFDVTSFLPYTEETLFENSLLVQNSGALELSSMRSVFQSLTTNARKIYILLVKHQLENTGNPNYQGMFFKDLYSKCREGFLVSSDIALRAQLTELLDHKLAKIKRTVEGTENITIPIKSQLLEQFLLNLLK